MSKVAIVTGGTRGIGYAITDHLSKDGYQVAAIYHGNEQAASKTESDTGVKTFKVDIADYSACETLVSDIEKKLGEISVLVNNAGITRDRALHKMSEEDWVSVINTNLNSCFNMCRNVVPYMRERQFGRIINISSINGQKGQFGQTNYAAAKAGILGLTKSLALESARKNITVNAICPGYIETNMTSEMKQDVLESIINDIPLGRLGRTQEIASAVSYLVSPAADFITGATFSINGGQYLA